MVMEGTYTPIGVPKQFLGGTLVKNGYRNWVPCIDECSVKTGVESWEDGLRRARLETEKEIVTASNSKLKQLGVDSVQITEGIKGYKAGKKTLSFKQNGCFLETLDFNDKAGMKKVIAMLQDIKASGKKFSIDQLSYILKNFR